MEIPEEGDVVALVEQTTFDFPGDGDDASISGADRILDGFQAAPNHLARVDAGATRMQSPIDARNKPTLSNN